jgi:SagB-type dehydrogenase family enzyme
MTNDIGKQFIELTKYEHLDPSPQSQGVPLPPLELAVEPSTALLDLPSPASLQIPALDLRQAIEKRETARVYSQTPLSLDEMAYLLWCTQGVKSMTDRPTTRRTVPSAGARNAFETWLLVNRVQTLDSGLYRYLALSHQLTRLPADPNIAGQLTAACLSQKHVMESGLTFIWVAVVERMTWRYPGRGYRYLFLDAGHICQNLYLAAQQIGCGVCAIAAFDDDLVNQAIQVDGEYLFAAYLATLGKLPH